MLTIRDTQIQSFQKEIDEDFVNAIAADIRQNPVGKSEEIPDDRLRQMVEKGVARARRHEMTKKYPIAMFVRLMFIIGPDFDEYPPVKFGLQDLQIPPNERLDVVIDKMTEQQWENAKRRSDQSVWEL